jgi:putative peptide zinc metalloprotease protein
MAAAAPASDLERRKRLRITLRPDLAIEEHRYEGRTFFVVKDPVSLRYYRLKDNEHFLLQFLDGRHTLEEAQKAYEREYRPERLKLEDLEGFAQQLLTAGLALSESPRAGKQLFERRGKRQRTEWLQTLTNILYIKIPIFDPERLLQWMLGYLWWIFSLWFFTLSVMFMAAAILLVATHFEYFRSKVPDYQEFFSLKSAVYLWVALGVVKVIHEFGHGLSCKVFGGEVHEMGALLMCFSPALYCNVSDAWILPSKWHRIIISAAGIYVELVIAAASTFVWWNTPTGTFTNNMALSLMIVCSVSTVVFNANPLMRYDGYYVLADWLEIPNLREKSNRFLKNLVLDKCLGVEVPPEEYMELWRKLLFVGYAIVSYVYRWVVTFGILYLFFTFLRPYKLEVVGHILTLAAIASMTVWPVFRLFKGIYRRGRLPDMKRGRVTITAAVVLLLIGFVCLVPIPISRIRGQALVQPSPEAMALVSLKRKAILTDLKVQPGESVRQGMVLATFRDPQLDEELTRAAVEHQSNTDQLELLQRQRKQTVDEKELGKIDADIATYTGKRNATRETERTLRQVKEEELVLVAPRDGVVSQGPRLEDIGKEFEGGRDQARVPPVFSLYVPGEVRLCMPLVTSDYNRLRGSLEELKAENEKRAQAREPEKDLSVVLRIVGLDTSVWKGKIARLDESEMRDVPPMLASRNGGPVPVRAPTGKTQAMFPQKQYYLAYVDIVDPDPAIAVGALGQVTIYGQPETCLHWLWRTVNDIFNLKLI